MYEALCAIIPGLQNHLLNLESDENILHVADLVHGIFFSSSIFNLPVHLSQIQKGASSA